MGANKDKSQSTAEVQLRGEAEKRLRAKKADLRPPRSEKDAKRLVHELEVHQIELEMQNAELRQAREELELSHNNYVELYDFAPVGYFTFDPQGRIKEVNLTGAKLLGAERRGLAGRPFTGFIADADDKDIFSKHCQAVIQTKVNATCEIRLARKDGAAFWAQLQSIAAENIKEEICFIRTTVIDITEHKKAEHRIEHLASFPELSPHPVIETDINGKITYFNTASLKILEKLNIPASDIHLLLPHDLSQVIKEQQAQEKEQEYDGRYAVREVEINGRVFIESIIVPDHLNVARIYAQEITKRKQAELALKESEKLYRAIGESINYGIWVCDPDGRNIYASDSFLRLVGLTQTQCSNFGWSDVLHPDDVEATLAKWKECVRTEGVWDVEHRYRAADGHWHPILARGVPVRNDQGDIIYWAGINLDISRIKQAEEALLLAQGELEKRVEERTAELKTALSEIEAMKDRLEAENIYFRQENKIKHQFENIIGEGDGLKYVLYRAQQVAPANTTVLILGETGTGKELIAAAIHNLSPRKDRPLITVNCAALPANLIESELFGREKGAFTGADTRRMGRFEIANGSTLCLDEIGELPLELQIKLLRVIQHHEFERLGSSHTIKVDVRIVATTNRDLEKEVREGRFRQDLYYRLNVFPITVLPLRQRQEDIPLLVKAFVERYSRNLGKKITTISKETMQMLQDYPWPGNIRELESIIERAVILCAGPVLHLADKLDISSPATASAARTLEEAERNQMLKIFSETKWRIEGKDGAAAILGLNASTLRARMHKLGIVRPQIKKTH